MANTKLWLIVGAVILALLIVILTLNRSPTPANNVEADDAHNAFMVDGAKNDKGTGQTFKLGDAPQKPKSGNTN